MRAALSIVIPTLNAAGELPPALAALFEGVETGLVRELVISDGGSADDTIALAGAAGALVVSGRAGRGGQLARGAAQAGGEWLLFLHADTCLSAGWSDAVRAHVAGSSGRAGYFRLRFRATGPGPRWVAGWANLRARLLHLPYGDQGLLISRRLYDQLGGFADLPLMEDVDMARRLGRRLVRLGAVAETGAGRFRRNGWLRGGARNLWTLARFSLGADPERLARQYRRR